MIEKIKVKDVEGKDFVDIIAVLFDKIQELVDAVNEQAKPVEMPPYNQNFHHYFGLMKPVLCADGVTRCGRCGYVFSGEHDCRLKDFVLLNKDNQLDQTKKPTK